MGQQSILTALLWTVASFDILTSFRPIKDKIFYFDNNVAAYNFQKETQIVMPSVGDYLRF